MKSHTKNLRFNHNPLNLILGTRKKQGLRIGYMEAALDGFYLKVSSINSIYPLVSDSRTL